MTTIRVFLCYAREDSAPVGDLYRQLSESGFSPWMDTENLLPGEDWSGALAKAIRECHFFVVCLSDSSVSKRGVIQVEIKEALEAWRGKLDSDIFLIPARLADCQVPDVLSKFQWVDLWQQGGYERLVRALESGIERLGIVRPIVLRSVPADPLSADDVRIMLRKRGFFDKHGNWLAKGIRHLYEASNRQGSAVITDRSTGLMWQQSGSEEALDYEAALEYVRQLNQDEVAGFTDWRLPTLEEAMSLMEPLPSEKSLFLDRSFDAKQNWIWTTDNKGEGNHPQMDAWVVSFASGSCLVGRMMSFDAYVRCVRGMG